uniref:WGS project CBMI000000000 data, contig CS3069_c001696 n=1 Tax=Fusarium clavum TaxID=2594811 RepID=A0A090MG51_9HYPO|nr:unnamed protein product [Fusarium clavum]
MCEHRIIWRYCPHCRKTAGPPLLQNVNCEKVTIWKLGRCRLGLCDREIIEHVECSECETKRITERDDMRRRLWEKAWPAPVQLAEGIKAPVMMDASQQTEEAWPVIEKTGKVEDKGSDMVIVQPEVMYDADDERDGEGLFIASKKRKTKQKSD